MGSHFQSSEPGPCSPCHTGTQVQLSAHGNEVGLKVLYLDTSRSLAAVLEELYSAGVSCRVCANGGVVNVTICLAKEVAAIFNIISKIGGDIEWFEPCSSCSAELGIGFLEAAVAAQRLTSGTTSPAKLFPSAAESPSRMCNILQVRSESCCSVFSPFPNARLQLVHTSAFTRVHFLQAGFGETCVTKRVAVRGDSPQMREQAHIVYAPG
jgi:hypothetical protein